MRFVKSIFKPFVVAIAMIAIAFFAVVKVSIVKLKIKSLYKYVAKLDTAKKRLYRLVFNPYRISNGIRPVWMAAANDPIADINKCHEIILKARLAKSAS